jgi:hypothetical protein
MFGMYRRKMDKINKFHLGLSTNNKKEIEPITDINQHRDSITMLYFITLFSN